MEELYEFCISTPARTTIKVLTARKRTESVRWKRSCGTEVCFLSYIQKFEQMSSFSSKMISLFLEHSRFFSLHDVMLIQDTKLRFLFQEQQQLPATFHA